MVAGSYPSLYLFYVLVWVVNEFVVALSHHHPCSHKSNKSLPRQQRLFLAEGSRSHAVMGSRLHLPDIGALSKHLFLLFAFGLQGSLVFMVPGLFPCPITLRWQTKCFYFSQHGPVALSRRQRTFRFFCELVQLKKRLPGPVVRSRSCLLLRGSDSSLGACCGCCFPDSHSSNASVFWVSSRFWLFKESRWGNKAEGKVTWTEIWKAKPHYKFLIQVVYDIVASPFSLHTWGLIESPLCLKKGTNEHILHCCTMALGEGHQFRTWVGKEVLPF